MQYKDHEPIPIDKFNGLWDRNDPDNCPLDHFQDCNNLRFFGLNSFGSRFGIGITQNVQVPITNVVRFYNYPTLSANTLLVLSMVGGLGQIYHVVDRNTVYGPILSIDGMTDFAFVPFAGRAYISPFTSYPYGDTYIEKGLPNEFIYVYSGDGSPARKAAGEPLSGTLTISNGIAGHTDAGFHLFAIVAETNTGYLTPPGAITGFTTSPGSSVSFGNIPTGLLTTITKGQFFPDNIFENPDQFIDEQLFLDKITSIPLIDTTLIGEEERYSTVNPSYSINIIGSPYIVKRHLVATKKITNYNGNPEGYTFYFVPNATIANNTDTFLNDISFYDQDLLDDASHLFDNYSEIPAVASLCIYRGRLIACASYDNINFAVASHPGEPEAIDQIDGLLAVVPDANPITNCIEYRDVLYIMRRARTVSFNDNDDEPATWKPVTVDTALGCPVHGIATVLDSGGSNVDFLIITTLQGISIFNGKYITPELSWKIENFWAQQSRNNFRKIQILNANIKKEIYCILPDGRLLVGNYANGMDPMKMRWVPLSFEMSVNTIGIWNIDEIIIGARES